MKILCLIFSWKGQYKNALKLEKQLLDSNISTMVINSDDDNQPENWINIGNECYFSDQFRKALEIFNNLDYDFLWHIQADASYDDWDSIIESAKSSYQKYNWGVFAPNVDDTFYISERTDVFDLEDDLKLVATTDNTCWIIHKDMIKQINDNISLMEDNHLGWGWDLLLCSFAHIQKRLVIRDYKFTVNHPPSTGYKKDIAEQEMFDMFNKCPDEIRKSIYFIKQSPNNILSYYDIDLPKTVSPVTSGFVYDTEVMFR